MPKVFDALLGIEVVASNAEEARIIIGKIIKEVRKRREVINFDFQSPYIYQSELVRAKVVAESTDTTERR